MEVVSVGANTEFLKITDSEVQAFNCDTLSSTTGIFKVDNDGSGVLVSGYDFDNETVSIIRVMMESGGIPSSSGDKCNTCCSGEVLTNPGISTKDVVAGCSWALDVNATVGILTVPGYYQLLRKQTPGISSNSVVSVRTISKEAIESIPNALKFGNNN